jgi:hypothetical protein
MITKILENAGIIAKSFRQSGTLTKRIARNKNFLAIEIKFVMNGDLGNLDRVRKLEQ